MSDSITQEDFREDNVAKAIVDSAFAVHKYFGPGLLESVYEAALNAELSKRGIETIRQKSFPIIYDGIELDQKFRLDLLVEDRVIVELKTVDKILPIHEAQILSYLRLTKKRLGLIINFNVPLLKDGIKRVVLRK